jgi:hypothetical protein
MSLYKGTVKSISIPDSTNVELKLPKGSREHIIQIVSPSDYFIAFSDQDMTDENRLELTAGDKYIIESSVSSGVSVFVRQESGGNLLIKWGYLYPILR